MLDDRIGHSNEVAGRSGGKNAEWSRDYVG